VQFFLDRVNLLLIAMACLSGGFLLWPLLRDRAAAQRDDAGGTQ